jgi:hypothetical protein
VTKQLVWNVEKLRSPPVVGEVYRVPCVYGQIALLSQGQVKSPEWWPIMRPSHQDSVYYPQIRSIWKPSEDGVTTILVEETFYEDDPSTDHHYHIDPRFAPDEFYTSWELIHQDYHNVINVQSEVKWREMTCLRDMPTQRLFTGFGRRFIDDHKDKKIKCGRCPHKGVLLNSVPVIDGVITCPNHGLKFDAVTKKCITE